MKQLIITLGLLIMFQTTYSQGSSQLDRKNGFNIFILGSTLEANKKLAKLNRLKQKEKSNGTEIYEVKGSDDIKLFSYNLASISLCFYNNVLYQIQVNLKNWGDGKNVQSGLVAMDISKQIANEYGPWTRLDLVIKDDLNNVNFKEIITSNRVSLWHFGYKGTRVADFETLYRGDNYIFVSNEVSNKMRAEQGNANGL